MSLIKKGEGRNKGAAHFPKSIRGVRIKGVGKLMVKPIELRKKMPK